MHKTKYGKVAIVDDTAVEFHEKGGDSVVDRLAGSNRIPVWCHCIKVKGKKIECQITVPWFALTILYSLAHHTDKMSSPI